MKRLFLILLGIMSVPCLADTLLESSDPAPIVTNPTGYELKVGCVDQGQYYWVSKTKKYNRPAGLAFNYWIYLTNAVTGDQEEYGGQSINVYPKTISGLRLNDAASYSMKTSRVTMPRYVRTNDAGIAFVRVGPVSRPAVEDGGEYWFSWNLKWGVQAKRQKLYRYAYGSEYGEDGWPDMWLGHDTETGYRGFIQGSSTPPGHGFLTFPEYPDLYEGDEIDPDTGIPIVEEEEEEATVSSTTTTNSMVTWIRASINETELADDELEFLDSEPNGVDSLMCQWRRYSRHYSESEYTTVEATSLTAADSELTDDEIVAYASLYYPEYYLETSEPMDITGLTFDAYIQCTGYTEHYGDPNYPDPNVTIPITMQVSNSNDEKTRHLIRPADIAIAFQDPNELEGGFDPHYAPFDDAGMEVLIIPAWDAGAKCVIEQNMSMLFMFADFWLSDNAMLDENGDGIVNFLDFAGKPEILVKDDITLLKEEIAELEEDLAYMENALAELDATYADDPDDALYLMVRSLYVQSIESYQTELAAKQLELAALESEA